MQRQLKGMFFRVVFWVVFVLFVLFFTQQHFHKPNWDKLEVIQQTEEEQTEQLYQTHCLSSKFQYPSMNTEGLICSLQILAFPAIELFLHQQG